MAEAYILSKGNEGGHPQPLIETKMNRPVKDFTQACEKKLPEQDFRAARESGMWDNLLRFRADLLQWLRNCNGELYRVMDTRPCVFKWYSFLLFVLIL